MFSTACGQTHGELELEIRQKDKKRSKREATEAEVGISNLRGSYWFVVSRNVFQMAATMGALCAGRDESRLDL